MYESGTTKHNCQHKASLIISISREKKKKAQQHNGFIHGQTRELKTSLIYPKKIQSNTINLQFAMHLKERRKVEQRILPCEHVLCHRCESCQHQFVSSCIMRIKMGSQKVCQALFECIDRQFVLLKVVSLVGRVGEDIKCKDKE